MPPCLHVYKPAAQQRTSRPPCLHAFTSPHLQRASHSCIPPYFYVTTAAVSFLELHTSTPPRHYTYIDPPDLHASMPPCFHVATPAARLQTSLPPCLRVATPVAHL